MRLNTLVGDNITEARIVATLDPLLGRYASEREVGEHFGDFLHRVGVVALPPYPTHALVAASEGTTRGQRQPGGST